MNKLYLIVTFNILLTSCATQIVRWPDKSDEQQSRSLEKVSNKSIFNDFLWTTPPTSAIEIESEFFFNNEAYSFEVNNEQLTIFKDDKKFEFSKMKSDGEIYPNTDFLEPTTKIVTKWVPKTRTVTETVPVQKTRTVPVTSFNADGTSSTSFQTEFYTDFETRFVTKTEWVWESYSELSYKVPRFEYFNVEIDSNTNFYIYVINDKYYLQNPSYLLCKEMNQSFWGEKEVNLIFIDSNANGIFLEEDDHILFNIWNPYDPDSSYKEISYLMDNKWYYLDTLKKELYLEFSMDADLINISYLNEEFIGNEKSGTLTINGIENLQTKTYVNGKKYNIKNNKPFNIEFGQFNIKVILANHVDYFDSFRIDDQNQHHIIKYNITEPAALLKIKNIFSNNYFVNISNSTYNKTYYKLKEINLPYGENFVEINVNGFSLKKTINVSSSEEIEIDFEDEIQKIQ